MGTPGCDLSPRRPPPRSFHVCLQQALAERNGNTAPEGEHDDRWGGGMHRPAAKPRHTVPYGWTTCQTAPYQLAPLVPWCSEEDAKGMARLFAEVGEAYTALIAEGSPQVRRAAAAAGGCCGLHWGAGGCSE